MSGGIMDEIANARLRKTVVEPKPADAKGDLLSAIRAVDRSTLKKASDRKVGDLKAAPSENSAEGQSLMNALAARMSAIRPSIEDDSDSEDDDWDDVCAKGNNQQHHQLVSAFFCCFPLFFCPVFLWSFPSSFFFFKQRQFFGFGFFV